MPFWTRQSAPTPAPAGAPPTGELRCSFCTKSQREVHKIVAGPSAWICNECIDLSAEILRGETAAKVEIPTLDALVATLSARVLGQEVAVRAVAAALVHHLHARRTERYRAPRLLLAGPRGCGKSALVAAACEAVPGLASYHADAGRITESGYVGEDVENLVGGLLARAPNLDDAVHGLLALDGLHHLAQRGIDGRTTRDVGGREAQRDLVRLLDGLELAAIRGGPRHPQAAHEHLRPDRIAVLATVTTDAAPGDEQALRRALVAEGLVDETLSRIETVVHLPALGEEALAAVAGERLRHTLAAIPHARVEATVSGLRALARRAAASGDGAHGLAPPLARLRERLWLEPGRALVLDEDLVRALSGPR